MSKINKHRLVPYYDISIENQILSTFTTECNTYCLLVSRFIYGNYYLSGSLAITKDLNDDHLFPTDPVV